MGKGLCQEEHRERGRIDVDEGLMRRHGQSLLLGAFAFLLLGAGFLNTDKAAFATTLVVLATACFVLAVLLSRAAGPLELGPLKMALVKELGDQAEKEGLTPPQTAAATARLLDSLRRNAGIRAAPLAEADMRGKLLQDAIREGLNPTSQDGDLKRRLETLSTRADRILAQIRERS
jgi:hypothetical protein